MTTDADLREQPAASARLGAALSSTALSGATLSGAALSGAALSETASVSSGATPEERRAVKFVAVTGVLLFVAITPIYGWVFSRGVLLGAVLAIANLLLTAQSVRAFLGGNMGPAESRTGATWGTFVVFKLLVLSLGTYLLLHYGLVQGFALIVGLAALPLGVVCLQLAGPMAPPRPRN